MRKTASQIKNTTHRHGGHSLFNGRLVAAAVLVVQVNVVRPQSLQTGREGFPADVRGTWLMQSY